MTFDIEIRSSSYVKVIGSSSRSYEEKCPKMKLKFEKPTWTKSRPEVETVNK